MAQGRSHKATVNRLAKKFRAKPNAGPGADIKTDDVAIEVETPQTVRGGIRQLQGNQKPVYIAGTNQEAVEEALKVTEATTVGVMNNQGAVIKKSTRRRRS